MRRLSLSLKLNTLRLISGSVVMIMNFPTMLFHENPVHA